VHSIYKFVSKHKRLFDIIIFLLIYFAICCPLILKATLIENTIHSFTETRFVGLLESLKNDAYIFILLILLLYISTLVKINKIANILIKTIICTIFFINLIDYFVILNFSNKLDLEDVAKYGTYSFKFLIDIYGKKLFYSALIALIAGILIIYFIFKNYKILQNQIVNIATILIIVFFVIILFLPKSKNIDFKTYEILLKYTSSSSSKNLEYSQDFINNFSFKDTKTCHPSTQNSPNIIILMAESLSSYHSQFFSGINNLTPNIDKIAKNNIAFTNFYANGSYTENAELALLTGFTSIKPPQKKMRKEYSFNGFFNLESSLPNTLKQNGYYTEFLTTADLNFASTGKWAKSIGFDYMEDSRNKFYKNYEKFLFGATADEFLFKRVLQRIKSTKKPRLTFIKTVNSHMPYIHPKTKEQSEFKTIKYVDEEIGKFYDKLKKSGFFNNGILIILGDHHTSQMPSKKEVELYGYVKSQAMVPMIISYGDKKPQIINQQFQQADIYNSIRNLVLNQSCHSNWLGDVFIQKSPKYIIFKREDRKHIITIFEQEKIYEVILDSNNSRIYNNADIDDKTKQYFINKINAQRILPLKDPYFVD